jgi:nucleotide-binding universal stress UspA family protein
MMTNPNQPSETYAPDRSRVGVALTTHRLLVPVDFSEHSRRALQLATWIAGSVGAEVHVLHVLQIPEMFGVETSHAIGFERRALTTLMVHSAKSQLDAFVADAKRDGALVTRSFTALGRPSRAIVETARLEGYELIVMGTHGRTGFSHLMLGSVAERVVRAASCPTLTVRDVPSWARKFGRILVPVDYSDTSMSVLVWADAFAREFGAYLDVVHIWDRPLFVPGRVMVREQGGGTRSLSELIREGAEREMREFLVRFRERTTGADRDLPRYRLLSGEPAATLLADLAKGSHDLVVLGTRGHSGLEHLLLGSVAEKLVRLAPVPVLVVPPAARARNTSTQETRS